jgi:hypothetical protein
MEVQPLNHGRCDRAIRAAADADHIGDVNDMIVNPNPK